MSSEARPYSQTDNDIQHGVRVLSKHAESSALKHKTDDAYVQPRQVMLGASATHPARHDKLPASKSIRVPAMLAGLAKPVAPAATGQSDRSRLITTSRLKPTSELAPIYQDGTVGGTDACWRDVELRGAAYAAPVRFSKRTFSTTAALHASQAQAQAHRSAQAEDAEAGIITDTDSAYIEGIDDSTLILERHVNQRVVSTRGAAHPSATLQPSATPSERIGRLMRKDSAAPVPASPAPASSRTFCPEAKVDAVTSAFRAFEKESPGHAVEREMDSVLKRISSDIFNYKRLAAQRREALGERPGDASAPPPAATLAELKASIAALSTALLADRNDGVLPLEFFDAEDIYEMHTPEGWLSLHRRTFELPDGTIVEGTPAFSRYVVSDSGSTQFLLQPVIATEYRPDERCYVVEWVPRGSVMRPRDPADPFCTNLFCAHNIRSNNVDGVDDCADAVAYDDVVTRTIGIRKPVKRLNVLFRDEDARMWWQRRWAAHQCRVRIESESRLGVFLALYLDRALRYREMRTELSSYSTARIGDLEVTPLLEILSDVSGPTAEVIDDIFQGYVLDNAMFAQTFLRRLGPDAARRMTALAEAMVPDVTTDFIQSNMLATVDYLRRSERFDASVKQIGLCPPMFSSRGDEQRRIARERFVATLSGSFLPGKPVTSIVRFLKRRARVERTLFGTCAGFCAAWRLVQYELLSFRSKEGLLFFNVAAVASFLAAEQVALLKTGVAGGVLADAESFRILLSDHAGAPARGAQDALQGAPQGKEAAAAPASAPAGAPESGEELLTLPYYAAIPSESNPLFDEGYVSPGLPVQLGTFAKISDNHRERMVAYVLETLHVDLGGAVLAALNDAGLSLYISSHVLRELIEREAQRHGEALLVQMLGAAAAPGYLGRLAPRQPSFAGQDLSGTIAASTQLGNSQTSARAEREQAVSAKLLTMQHDLPASIAEITRLKQPLAPQDARAIAAESAVLSALKVGELRRSVEKNLQASTSAGADAGIGASALSSSQLRNSVTSVGSQDQLARLLGSAADEPGSGGPGGRGSLADSLLQTQDMSALSGSGVQHDLSQTLTDSVRAEILGNLLAKPRLRNILDVFMFCRLVNTVLYDVLMLAVERTVVKYNTMLLCFRGSNILPFDSVLEYMGVLCRRFTKRTNSAEAVAGILTDASRSLFGYIPQTAVRKSLLQVYITFSPHTYEIAALDKVSSGTWQYFHSLCAGETADTGDTSTTGAADMLKYVEENVALNEARFPSGASDGRPPSELDVQMTHRAIQNMADDTKASVAPNVHRLEFGLYPSIESGRDAVTQNFAQITAIPTRVPCFEALIPCFTEDNSECRMGTLPAPDASHDPWLPQRRAELEDLCAQAEEGPIALLTVLHILYRQLYYVDHNDYVDADELQRLLDQNFGPDGYYAVTRSRERLAFRIKVLPPIDEIHNVVAVEEDVANAEDAALAAHGGWDYPYDDEGQQRRNAEVEAVRAARAQPAQAQDRDVSEHDTDSEGGSDASDASDAAGATRADRSSEPTDPRSRVDYIIDNRSLSLRDLRRLLTRYTAVREVLRRLPVRADFGLYNVDCTAFVDILQRRCALLRAQAARTVHFRAQGIARRLVHEWDDLREKMHTEAKTPEAYAEIRAYVVGIDQRIPEMTRRQAVLELYMGVLDEFRLTQADFYRPLYAAEDALVKLAAAKTAGSYSKLVDKYRSRFSHLYTNFEAFGDKELHTLYWAVRAKPRGVLANKPLADAKLIEECAALLAVKEGERADLSELVAKYAAMTVSFAQRATLSDAPAYAEELAQIQKYRERVRERLERFALEEAQLGSPPSDWAAFAGATDDFRIFEELWTVVAAYTHNYPVWFSGAFIDLAPRTIGAQISEWTGSLARLQKSLAKIGRTAGAYARLRDKDRGACCQESVPICTEVIAKLDEFRAILPLVESLRSAGLRPHHWKEVSKSSHSRANIQPVASLTLRQLIADGFLEPHALERVRSIAEAATRELQIERSLEKIAADWKPVVIEMKLYGQHEVAEPNPSDPAGAPRVRVFPFHIAKTFDDVLQLLDEQFSVLQGMHASAFAERFEARIGQWERRLVYLQDIVEEWSRYQRLWLYLEPIFTSEDIRRQLPAEAERFAETCVFWSDQSSETARSPAAMTLANKDGLVEKFQAHFRILEGVNRQLSSYLEAKRRAFARFFFLSDEELLQILAQTRDPEAVQAHISKCFEGIRRLGFRDSAGDAGGAAGAEGAEAAGGPGGRKEIFSMTSVEQESVALSKVVVPAGDADAWLCEIEDSMKHTLQTLIKDSFVDCLASGQRLDDLRALSAPRPQPVAIAAAATVASPQRADDAGALPKKRSKSIRGGGAPPHGLEDGPSSSAVAGAAKESASTPPDAASAAAATATATPADGPAAEHPPLVQAYADTIMEPRERWMARWPVQVVVVLCQIVWTHETAAAIRRQEATDPQALDRYLLKLNYDIDKLVRWVGHVPGAGAGAGPKGEGEGEDAVPMSPNIRALLMILLTLHVRNRDVVALIRQAFFHPSADADYSFIWESELKYHYSLSSSFVVRTDASGAEAPPTTRRRPINVANESVTVTQVNSTLLYQYEYLGVGTRLIVTGLTSRCYLTLTTALHNCLFAAPQGPAGTGKTETTKDLSKAIATQCLVFNCSEGLDVSSMGRMFKGLAMSGAWSCFDEFNRIDVEVLSVIAQQILTIQQAITKASALPPAQAREMTFLFEGANIPINKSCAAFITMNPGYAGRAELPDNLKALFRPISMTIPDYSLIAEVMLFACGYREASKLAVKTCMALKLLSEQLSKQDHYDFGMRALKSILSAAARLKRLYYTEPEEVLCLRAIGDVNVPKFLAQDVVLYNNIVSDLFPGCHARRRRPSSAAGPLGVRGADGPAGAPAESGGEQIAGVDGADGTEDTPEERLLDASDFGVPEGIPLGIDSDELVTLFIAGHARAAGLSDAEAFVDKTMQLYKTLAVRHGLMNVGRTMSGKSTITSVLQHALTNVHVFLARNPDLAARFPHEAFPLFYAVGVYKLNAKSITMSELYGSFSAVSNEWTDGILATIMRECIREEPEYRLKWLLLDSPVDALWIESMNTVLDDNKKLCLTSGEIITMTPNMTVFFEVGDLAAASPATVSRTGMIYCDQTLIDPEALFLATLRKLLPSWFLDLRLDLTPSWPVVTCGQNHDYAPPDDAAAASAGPPSSARSAASATSAAKYAGMVFRNTAELSVAGRLMPHGRVSVHTSPTLEMTCVERLVNLFRWLGATIIREMLRSCRPTIYTTEALLTLTLVKGMAAFLAQFAAPGEDVFVTEGDVDEWAKKLPPLADPASFIDSVFVFALTWSVGAFSDLPARSYFGALFRHIAYDLPVLLLANAAAAGADVGYPRVRDARPSVLAPTFNAASLKIQRSEREAIDARGFDLRRVYHRIIPDFEGRQLYIWRMQRPIVYTRDERDLELPDAVVLPHDVFFSVHLPRAAAFFAEGDADANVTPLLVAQRLEMEWVPWSRSRCNIPMPTVDVSTPFNDTVVPTKDFTSLVALLRMYNGAGFPALLAGPSGAGKSTIVRELVANQPGLILLKCCLTAFTTTSQLRSIVDPRLEKRRRGIYSFARGRRALLFVDDAQMPEKELYGARPPHEVLRQLLEDEGWYDVAEGLFKRILNLSTVVGCTTGDSPADTLPERLLHHLCLLSVPEASDDAFRTIFSALLGPFGATVGNPGAALVDTVVSASIQLYREVSRAFRSTPAHAHYVFSPRDLSKVFQGMMICLKGGSAAAPSFSRYMSAESVVAGLWVHEVSRVFGDRLVCADDARQFTALMESSWNTCSVSGGAPPPLKPLLQGGLRAEAPYDIYFGTAHSDDDLLYKQVFLPDKGCADVTSPRESMKDEVTPCFYTALTEFNRSATASSRMNLVLFKYAIVHLLRIARVLVMDRGHALLIGMPSSGKRSLARLAAASISGYYSTLEPLAGKSYVYTRPGAVGIFEPTGKADFLDTIKSAIHRAAVDAQPALLIVHDPVADNAGLECINFLVSLGEVPNLWAADELTALDEAIMADLARFRKGGGEDVSKAYVQEVVADRVLRNLHVVIAVTPESPNLGKIVSAFPSLLGSLSVDWFTPWETDTLRNIARFYLREGSDPDTIADIVVTIHRDTEALIGEKYPTLCASPATFLGILTMYRTLLARLGSRIEGSRARYASGIARFAETEEAVETLRAEQTAKQPVLAAAQKDSLALARSIEAKRVEVGTVKETLVAEESVAARAAREADDLAESCQEDLRRAEPLIVRAQKALGALRPQDVNEARSLATPPRLVRFVMDAICIIKGIKISLAPDADNWPTAQKMLRANGFLQSLKTYNAEEMPDHVSTQLGRLYIPSPDFDPVAVQKASIAAAGLCEWVHAVYQYCLVMREVRPKRERLAVAMAEAKRLQDELLAKQASLRAAQDELSGLEAHAETTRRELNRLSDEYDLCVSRLKRAEGLIAGLSGEKVRWGTEVRKREQELRHIIPTALMATAFCSALGGIDFADRAVLAQKWGALIAEAFPEYVLSDFTIQGALVEPAVVTSWISRSLPRDTFSITSACIALASTRVPLLIDPQGQARRWAVSCLAQDMRGAKTPVKAVRLTDQALHKTIELALRTGAVLVIDGISSSRFVREDPRIKAAVTAANLISANEQAALLSGRAGSASSVDVRFGDAMIEVPNTFSLILIAATDIRVPPDAFGDFSVVTFKATREALEDLLLSVAVECERPELENQRRILQVAAADDATTLLGLETQLLILLSAAQGADGTDGGSGAPQLLDNVRLTSALSETQTRSQEIQRRILKAAKTAAEIDQARQLYTGLSRDASCLFFVLQRLTRLDTMYETSLQSFVSLFRTVIDANKALEGPDRLTTIAMCFAERLYTTVARGLFAKHKLPYALDICFSLELTGGRLLQSQMDLVHEAFSGGVACDALVQNNPIQGISTEQWTLLSNVCNRNVFSDMDLAVDGTIDLFERLLSVDANDVPGSADVAALTPLSYVVFCVCASRKNIQVAVRSYVQKTLGPAFTNVEAPSIADICTEGRNDVPTVILLSTGSDPSRAIMAVASSKNVPVYSISLGRGQGVYAQAGIAEAAISGGWVLLSNTHLAGPWLQKLESINEAIIDGSYNGYQELAETKGQGQSSDVPQQTSGKSALDSARSEEHKRKFTLHSAFRLFLTTVPFPQFPSSITRTSTKVSTEPPIGVKNNMVRMLSMFTNEDFDVAGDALRNLTLDKIDSIPMRRQTDPLRIAYNSTSRHRSLLWSLALYFSVVIERRRFGSIGFNSPYDWSDPDLFISKMQLRDKFIELASCDASSFSAKLSAAMVALKFLISEINIGGRVSDGKDRICVVSLMQAFYAENYLQLGKNVDNIYRIPALRAEESQSVAELTNHILSRWPDVDAPELYGLDSTSIIFLAQYTGKTLLETVLEMYAPSTGERLNRNKIASADTELAMLTDMVSSLPTEFDEEDVEKAFPTSYVQSMNTVIRHEISRYNILILLIRSSLVSAQNVIHGLIAMSKETEGVLRSIRLNQVPKLWETAAWPSLMALSRWLADLRDRVTFIRSWVNSGLPETVWFSGFFYPQAFLTGLLQNYARLSSIAIDELVFDFAIHHERPPPMEHAAVLTGLFLQSASLGPLGLEDAKEGILFEEIQFVNIIPVRAVELCVGTRYSCPVYRTSLRRGVLTTTGHSSNYIFDILVPSSDPPSKWVRRGTACFQQKD